MGKSETLLFLFFGRGWVVSDACTLLFFFYDEPGAPCHPGQDSAFLDPRPLRQSLIGSIVVQADGLLLAIIASDAAQTKPGMADQGSSFQAQAARSAIWFTFSPFRRLQAMKLAAMQSRGNEIPQAGTRGILGLTHAAC